MGLNKTDKDWIRLAVREETGKLLEPVRDLSVKHEQTLYGETGNNGLRKTVESHGKELQSIKVKMGWIAGAISAGLLIAKEIGSYLIGRRP